MEKMVKKNKKKSALPLSTGSTRKWVVLDAKGKVLGRLATQAAWILMGKHKATYVPYLDKGDAVVIVNAMEIRVTGKKESDKKYSWHTGFPRGYREMAYSDLKAFRPEEIIETAVSGMLPKNKLRKSRMNRLFVYKGKDHPHVAQKPVLWSSKVLSESSSK